MGFATKLYLCPKEIFGWLNVSLLGVEKKRVHIVSTGQELSETQSCVPGCISSPESEHCHPAQPLERRWRLRLKYLMSQWMRRARQPTYCSGWKTTQQLQGGGALEEPCENCRDNLQKIVNRFEQKVSFLKFPWLCVSVWWEQNSLKTLGVLALVLFLLSLSASQRTHLLEIPVKYVTLWVSYQLSRTIVRSLSKGWWTWVPV